MRILKLTRLFFTALAIIALVSCSKSDRNPVELNAGPNDIYQPSICDDNRNILAVYDVTIEPIAKTLILKPIERSLDYHLPLSRYFPNVVSIEGYGWTPNFWVDIKISHPFPQSGIVAFDPRVIAILPARDGVSFNYPVFNVMGNNKVVMSPDGYTPLFDWIAPSIPGNVNPFKAYLKGMPFRTWESSQPEETQRWDIDLDGFAGSSNFKLVVDVSTNYPSVGQPVVDNASEPVDIEAVIGAGITPNGGSADAEVTFLDWQGKGGIKCKVECPEIFSVPVELSYSQDGSNPHEYIFSGEISNELLAPHGRYSILIAAWDMASGVHIYKETSVSVEEINFNPIDVSPRWLSFTPLGVFIQGNYMYAAGSTQGLHIFDISDPLNPEWVNAVDIPNVETPVWSGYEKIRVLGDYAYIRDAENGLRIFDINPPELAHLVKEIDTVLGYRSGNICVSGEYAYIQASSNLIIYDIEPPEEAQEVSRFYCSGGQCVDVSGDYAYVALYDGMDVVDISNPLSPRREDWIYTPYDHTCTDVKVSDQYAYVVKDNSRLQIIDINLREWLKTVDIPQNCMEICLDGEYAYLVSYDGSLTIVDVSPPDTASVVKTIDVPIRSESIQISNGYAFISSLDFGITIVDVDPPGSAEIVGDIPTLTLIHELDVSNGYAYLENSSYQMGNRSEISIVDVSPVETSRIVKRIEMPDYSTDVLVNDRYAFVLNYNHDIQVIDIDPPESAYIYKTFPITQPYSMDISGDYAYLTNYSLGKGFLNIIDIEPVDSMQIINKIELVGGNEVVEKEGYVYLASAGLKIVDVDPPDSMSLVKTCDVDGIVYDLDVSGDFAYLTVLPFPPQTEDGIYIFDISVPQDAELINTLNPPSRPSDIYISDGYAYVTNDADGLTIIDVSQPASAFIVDTLLLPRSCFSIKVEDSYAYMAGVGFSVVELW